MGGYGSHRLMRHWWYHFAQVGFGSSCSDCLLGVGGFAFLSNKQGHAGVFTFKCKHSRECCLERSPIFKSQNFTGLPQHVQTSSDSLPDMQGWPYFWLYAQFCIPDTPIRGFLWPGEFIPHLQCRFLGVSLNFRSTRVHGCLRGAEVI